MRTILFRGYIKYPSDIINGFWYGDLIHYANGDIYIRQIETGMEYEVVPESVGQFTGKETDPFQNGNSEDDMPF